MIAAMPSTTVVARFLCPMRQIAYTYNPDRNNQIRIATENHAMLVNGQLVAGEAVSSIAGVGRTSTTLATETRGDGAARTFNYYSATRCTNKDCPPPPDTEPCHAEPEPTDGKMSSFTDFLGHPTT